MKVIALYSIKGGVGKTAAAVNLSHIAASEGAKTLLMDLDPQGSASFYLRIRSSRKFNARNLIKGRKKLNKNIKETDYKNLDLLPSNLSYRNLDIVLNDLKQSRKRLARVSEKLEENYEFIFLDCPPNITLVSENVFYAADYVIVPLIPTTLSALTYDKLLGFFSNNGLDGSKIFGFFSMVEKGKKMHKEIMETIPNNHGHFLKSRIPYAADVEKMGVYREPVTRFRPTSVAAQSFCDLWAEIKDLVA